MAANKKQQLILVVEGTAALGPYWRTILSSYLDKLIRSFCNSHSLKPFGTIVELALIIFNTHGCSCLVQRSGWTTNVDYLIEWLYSISFSGGGFCDSAAIAEGLGEALMMFSSTNVTRSQHGLGVQRHCILVAASNPHPFPTPVYRPRMQKTMPSDNSEAPLEIRLSDAESVAKAFTQCSASLSVICPKQLPKLRAVFSVAGNRTPSVVDPRIVTLINSNYLVLISEMFMEARAALSRSGITNLPSQSPVKVEQTCLPLVSGPPQTSVPPGLSQLAAGGPHSKYVKFWEGDLFGQRQGKPVFIVRIEGYHQSASAIVKSLAADWPPTIQIVRLVSPNFINKEESVTSKGFLVFHALHQHKFLGDLHEKKLCPLIELPSQTLTLSVSDETCRLSGMLFPAGAVVIKSQF